MERVEIDKSVLLELIASHSKLAQAEYHRDPGYNNEHFSHKAEDKMHNELTRLGLMDELFKYMDLLG